MSYFCRRCPCDGKRSGIRCSAGQIDLLAAKMEADSVHSYRALRKNEPESQDTERDPDLRRGQGLRELGGMPHLEFVRY